MGDIFREIDEELRQERFERLWKRYGKFIIGAAVAVVLIVGGYKFWEYYSLKQKEKSSVQYWFKNDFMKKMSSRSHSQITFCDPFL